MLIFRAGDAGPWRGFGKPRGCIYSIRQTSKSTTTRTATSRTRATRRDQRTGLDGATLSSSSEGTFRFARRVSLHDLEAAKTKHGAVPSWAAATTLPVNHVASMPGPGVYVDNTSQILGFSPSPDSTLSLLYPPVRLGMVKVTRPLNHAQHSLYKEGTSRVAVGALIVLSCLAHSPPRV